ncbi:MAG TPA: nucleotide-binding protein [Firmicutes bacterium]|nr:nucleotide-binding protein [Bacillota bacterium]
MKTRLIIFSSVKELKLAEAIQRNLYHKDYAVKIWTNGFFKLSKSYISHFSNIRTDYDYAVVLCSDDDLVKKKGARKYIPRDNVLLELGMCISEFSLEHVMIVKKDTISLPTDLDGIESICYNMEKDDDLDTIAGMICSSIMNHISKHTNQGYIKLSWDEYFYHLNNLIDTLKQSSGLGGFYFDIIIGINRGGLMVADLISREFGQNIPILAIYADRRTGKAVFDSTDLLISNKDILKILQNDRIKHILLTDSFTRDGVTIIEAKKYLTQNLNSKVIKSAVIYANRRLENTKALKSIDYIASFQDLDNKKLSLTF